LSEEAVEEAFAGEIGRILFKSWRAAAWPVWLNGVGYGVLTNKKYWDKLPKA